MSLEVVVLGLCVHLGLVAYSKLPKKRKRRSRRR